MGSKFLIKCPKKGVKKSTNNTEIILGGNNSRGGPRKNNPPNIIKTIQAYNIPPSSCRERILGGAVKLNSKFIRKIIFCIFFFIERIVNFLINLWYVINHYQINVIWNAKSFFKKQNFDLIFKKQQFFFHEYLFFKAFLIFKNFQQFFLIH